jgi:NAD(P)-dependent dehydrogenase (short-subunit alcohol dehydrogenase family)
LSFRANSLSQTNVKGAMITAKAFLPTANPSHAAILGVTTGASALPSAILPGLSAYIGSKLAQVKFLEFLSAENPNIFVASVHPGMVDTATFRKSGGQAEMMPMDKGWNLSVICSSLFCCSPLSLTSPGEAGIPRPENVILTSVFIVELPAHFMVWLASHEAKFLTGRLVWANWDVDELKTQAQQIHSGQQMTVGIVGWPFSNTG